MSPIRLVEVLGIHSMCKPAYGILGIDPKLKTADSK